MTCKRYHVGANSPGKYPARIRKEANAPVSEAAHVLKEINRDRAYALIMARAFMRRGTHGPKEALMMALNRLPIDSPIHRRWDKLMRRWRLK